MNESANHPDYRLLLTGDLHLGRSSSRVPSHAHRTSAAWERMVDLAIEERINTVLLAGDVADEQNRLWEVLGALENGLRRLAANDIRTIAVAGRHDFELLGRLANESLEGFTLLGRNEQWERITLEHSGTPVLHVDGWSFKSWQVDRSPVEDYELETDPNVPTLGLVHGNWEPTGSAFWVMGGAHQARLTEKKILRPGSLQALDPEETGSHGPWIAKICNGAVEPPEQRPLSSVRYASVKIDATGIVNADDLRSEIKEALQAHGERIAAASGSALEHIIVDIKITGQSDLAGRLTETLEQIERDFRMSFGTAVMTVDRARSDLLPDIDLEKHANQSSVLGTVASLLLELERDQRSVEVEELIEQTQKELAQVGAKPDFLGLTGSTVDVDQALNHLRRCGRELLVRLHEQSHA